MSTAEKWFTILGGDLPSILVKNFLILEQLGLVCLVGLYFVGVLFCTLVWVFFPSLFYKSCRTCTSVMASESLFL